MGAAAARVGQPVQLTLCCVDQQYSYARSRGLAAPARLQSRPAAAVTQPAACVRVSGCCQPSQDAARLRDQIKEIEEANKPQPPDMQGLTTSSDTVTDGVRVKVRR